MLTLKWHGTASIELACAEGGIIFDPFIPLKGSPVSVPIEKYDGFTDIIITHGHFDHIASLPEICKRNPAVRIFCTDAPFRVLTGKGISKNNLVRIEYGQLLKINGFGIMPFHGRHAVLPKATLSRLARILSDRNARNVPAILREVVKCRENGETVLYQIEAEGKSITLMGSMNLRNDVTYPTGSDYLILPYNGWEDNYPPAVHVIEVLKPKKILLDHYDDTFPPVTSPVDLKPILIRYGERIEALDYGERRLY